MKKFIFLIIIFIIFSLPAFSSTSAPASHRQSRITPSETAGFTGRTETNIIDINIITEELRDEDLPLALEEIKKREEEHSRRDENSFPKKIEKVWGEYPHIITPNDVENGVVQLELDFSYILYKDDSASEHMIPFLLRIDTGKNTELRISSAFLEYQPPYFGINDISLGFMWNFREKNPSMAVLTSVQLPTGSDHFSDDAVEPSLSFLTNYKFCDKWDLSVNVGWVNNYDGTKRYDRGKGSLQLGYAIDNTNYIGFFAGGYYPNESNGVGLTSTGINYSKHIRDDLQLTLTVSRGLSSIDKSWGVSIGVNQHL